MHFCHADYISCTALKAKASRSDSTQFFLKMYISNGVKIKPLSASNRHTQTHMHTISHHSESARHVALLQCQAVTATYLALIMLQTVDTICFHWISCAIHWEHAIFPHANDYQGLHFCTDSLSTTFLPDFTVWMCHKAIFVIILNSLITNWLFGDHR